jgi:hypothetical protein
MKDGMKDVVKDLVKDWAVNLKRGHVAHCKGACPC